MRVSHLLPRAVLAAVTLLLFTGCEPRESTWVFSGPTMGTTYTVRLVTNDALPAPAFIRGRIEEELTRVDLMASRYRADSELSKFNASAGGDWFAVTPELMVIVNSASEVTNTSRGAFDIASAQLVDAWGFGPTAQSPTVPDVAELTRLIRSCGSAQLEIRTHPPALRKQHACVALDLNGIAPGYAVDRIHDALLTLGARDFLIDIGGEVRAIGNSDRGEPWRVAVEDPRSNTQQAYTIVELKNLAIASSGGYRQYFERNGQRYSHVLDARTGLTADPNVATVAVIAKNAMMADAWATALYALGAEQAMHVAREHRIAALVLVREGGKLREHATPEFLRVHELSSAPVDGR